MVVSIQLQKEGEVELWYWYGTTSWSDERGVAGILQGAVKLHVGHDGIDAVPVMS